MLGEGAPGLTERKALAKSCCLSPSVDFMDERRTNASHRSTTDPEAKLYRKGDGVGACLCHSDCALTENRPGLVIGMLGDAQRTARRLSAGTCLRPMRC
jgi:hypothetical protein